MEENPELLQNGDWNGENRQVQAVPVFLIHDGGGTTFAYHCLDPLARPAYGIFNPYFRNGGRFEGGIRGMGRLYAGIIRRTCAESDFPAQRNSDGSVNILIGGWSMGGLLSLEIAKVLTGDCGVRIIGVLMMDSIYSVNPPSVRLEALDHLGLGKSKNEFLSLKAMKEALRVIQEWEPPVWAGDQVAKRPRISLLRALDHIPTGSDRVHVADIYRNDRTLGWDQYDMGMFTDIVSVPGNHFEMFSFQHIPEISKTIKRCLDKLEMLGSISH
ncbi:thioesterase domain-containing protein [Pseudomassariella vexata]|uniref:Thioesterase domain-containing protein n=1 Tax=Pseudomassariella vexata TaxID=1141098 RepID=A0A1Y2EHK3_9PEZI|nr:thioesterase domain-containing protein [Pseudomassariella vexata]ORY71043.1 thioesterase domain-containing protein [Pseudomassariella vexata]